jgi:hypothetical protein
VRLDDGTEVSYSPGYSGDAYYVYQGGERLRVTRTLAGAVSVERETKDWAWAPVDDDATQRRCVDAAQRFVNGEGETQSYDLAIHFEAGGHNMRYSHEEGVLRIDDDAGHTLRVRRDGMDTYDAAAPDAFGGTGANRRIERAPAPGGEREAEPTPPPAPRGREAELGAERTAALTADVGRILGGRPLPAAAVTPEGNAVLIEDEFEFVRDRLAGVRQAVSDSGVEFPMSEGGGIRRQFSIPAEGGEVGVFIATQRQDGTPLTAPEVHIQSPEGHVYAINARGQLYFMPAGGDRWYPLTVQELPTAPPPREEEAGPPGGAPPRFGGMMTEEVERAQEWARHIVGGVINPGGEINPRNQDVFTRRRLGVFHFVDRDLADATADLANEVMFSENVAGIHREAQRLFDAMQTTRGPIPGETLFDTDFWNYVVSALGVGETTVRETLSRHGIPPARIGELRDAFCTIVRRTMTEEAREI